MEYKFSRDFNASFAIDFKRYTSKADLQSAVGRFVDGQGMQAGTEYLAEILYNIVYDGVPSKASELVPMIMTYVKQNANQAGLEKLGEILDTIIEEGISDAEVASSGKEFVAAFVKQNGMQTGLPILVGDQSYTFGQFLTTLIGYVIE